MSVTFWVVLGLINIPAYIIVGKLFFKDWESFGEAIGYWLTPDAFSLFRGEFMEDFWAELKLGMFVAVCVGLVYAESEYLVVPYILPMFI